MKTLEIYYDLTVDSPRNWDNLGTIVQGKSKYKVGDIEVESLSEWFDDNKDLYKLPVYFYLHSGLTISTKPFNDRFDSGLLGYIFVKDNEGLSSDIIVGILKNEIAILNEYLQGNVFGYQIKDGDEVIDSLAGIIGVDELYYHLNEYSKEEIDKIIEKL